MPVCAFCETLGEIVPVLVIGFDAVQERPAPQVMLVTVPEPAGVAQVPSPRQNVLLEALVPLLSRLTDKLPIAWLTGTLVAFVRSPEAIVPSAPPAKRRAPVPLSSVTVPRKLALDGVPRNVSIPVAVVVVEGATPAPPPMTKLLADRAADEAHVDAELK